MFCRFLCFLEVNELLKSFESYKMPRQTPGELQEEYRRFFRRA